MTDTIFVDETGHFVVGKAQTTPEDEAVGVLRSSQDALQYWSTRPEDVFSSLISGVYSGTGMLNRLVQRKTQTVGLIVNAGTEDNAMRLRRGIESYLGYSYSDRLHVNTHHYDPPLVSRRYIRGVRERIDMFGQVIIPLYEADVERAVNELLDQDVKALVVVLLHSYLNESHEKKVKVIAENIMAHRGKQLPIFLSCEYYPVRMEVPRINTMVIEASAAEPSRGQMRSVESTAQKLGAPFRLRVMAAHGGTIGIDARELARTLISGPIGGVVGAKYLGEALGLRNLACTDIGGTSFDMGLVVDGDFAIDPTPTLARLLMTIPTVDIDSVGAGTGSFVRFNPVLRNLEIGPDSAGYRVGVSNPDGGIDTVTVTDCHVAIGLINPDFFLGGDIKLDRERAIEAIQTQVAEPLGLDVFDAALGVIELLESRLQNALEAEILGKGYAPANFVLLSYGGGGPLHTVGYGAKLGFEDMLVPAWAAGFSAFGCGAADFEYRYDRTMLIDIPREPEGTTWHTIADAMNQAWDELEGFVREEFVRGHYDPEQVTMRYLFRMQYQGQLNDLEVESPVIRIQSRQDLQRVLNAFEEIYTRVYSEAARSTELGFRLMAVTVRGRGDMPRVQLPDEPIQDPDNPDARKGTRRIYTRDGWQDAAIWDMSRCRAGNVIRGWSIVESPSTTLVIPAGYEGRLDRHLVFHLCPTES
ncbi:MAG: hydantoinase/oxoprolinase family protein [Firmicutes bacterium]|nr:hydantoinase/oxoprolinase family protein [Bacillota bacterium]